MWRQHFNTAKIIMCKLDSIKWAIVKSNKKISKNLTAKLVKVRFGSVQDNTFSFYYFNAQEFDKIVQILKSYKTQKFEIVRFYDKQFGLTINYWLGIDKGMDERINKLPLSNKFYWFNSGSRVSVTPITKKQFDNIIKIN